MYKGYHAQTQEIVAIKRISIEDLQHEKSARREIDSLTALGKCSHPNIVNLVDVVPGNKHTYLIMEYCDGGDMKQYLRTHALSERDVRYFFVQIGACFLAADAAVVL